MRNGQEGDCMAGDSSLISQADIESLLQQAQAAAENASAEAAAGDTTTLRIATESDVVNQPEMEATSGSSPAQQSAKSARPAAVRQAGDDISFLLNQAEAALASVDQPIQSSVDGLAPFELRDFGGAGISGEKATLELLRDVELDVKIELGRSQMQLEEVLRCGAARWWHSINSPATRWIFT